MLEAHSHSPLSLVAARRLAFAVLLAIYAGGVYRAWHALAIPRHALPAAEARQLGAALGVAAPGAAPGGYARSSRSLCGTTVRLHCTLLPAEQLQDSGQAVDLEALASQHLQPALRQLAAGAQVGSNLLLYPPLLPSEQLRWDAQHKVHILPAMEVVAWGQQMQQLAWSAGPAHSDPSPGAAAAQVLLYVPPAAHQPLLLEMAGGSLSASMELEDDSLLLIVNQNAEEGSSSSTQEVALAAAILSWLLQPIDGSRASSIGSDSDIPPLQVLQALRRSLTVACAAEAAEALQRFVGATEADPSQPVTAAMASCAAKVVELLQMVSTAQQHQQQQKGSEEMPSVAAALLVDARDAWAIAQQLLLDPGTGARQAFPPEHAMAVLLPLALPVSLVLVQAAGREVAAWRKRRCQPQGQPAADQEVDETERTKAD